MVSRAEQEYFDNQLQLLIETVKQNRREEPSEGWKNHFKPVEKAFNFALKAHDGQKRASGKPYFSHPLEVAKLLANYGLSNEVIIAALLHDVVEDTPVTSEEVKREFGEAVSHIVEGVTKLSKLADEDTPPRFEENLRKIFAAADKDIRVILIKIADNLHNMRTVKFLAPENRVTYASRALEVYAPIAHRLGMHEVKNELEDLGFEYAMPDEFASFKAALDKRQAEKAKDLMEIEKALKKDFKKQGLNVSFHLAAKSAYSVYAKLRRTHKQISEINDAMVLVAIMDSVDDCYKALGRVHTSFMPRPRKIKDFIAAPRPDLYQSLQTTIIGPKGQLAKVYIRTHRMNELRANGVIALMSGNESQRDNALDKAMNWIKGVINLSNDSKDLQAFMKNLKEDLLSEMIDVFTPEGKVLKLPEGSTPLDFAYALNDSIANHAEKASVNGKVVPLWSELVSGDKVEIVKSKRVQVKQDWLSYVKSPQNKEKIKNALEKAKAKFVEPHLVNMQLKCVDSPGVLYKLTEIIYAAKMNISSIYSSRAVYPVTCNFTLVFSEKKQFEHVLQQMERMDEVIEVRYHLL